MSRQVLVAYATKMGTTAEIAAAIGDELRQAPATTSGSERPACSQRLPPTSSVPAGSEGTAPTPGAPDPPMPACRIRPETNSSA